MGVGGGVGRTPCPATDPPLCHFGGLVIQWLNFYNSSFQNVVSIKRPRVSYPDS